MQADEACMPLTNKQQRFVEEYATDSNAKQAAIRAGYSERSAEVQGYQLLQKTSVAAAIRGVRRSVAEQLNITTQDVLNGLHTEATAGDTSEPNSSRVKAWEILGKHMGMFIERQEHGKPGDFKGLSEDELDSKINSYIDSGEQH